MSNLRGRGQAEVLGLLFLVILVIFAGFLYLRFAARGEGSEYADVRQSMEASSLLRALLQFESRGESFEGWVEECAVEAGACEELEERVEEIFGDVLRDGEDYLFVLRMEGEELVRTGDCTKGIVSTVPFTQEGELYEATLTLCSSV